MRVCLASKLKDIGCCRVVHHFIVRTPQLTQHPACVELCWAQLVKCFCCLLQTSRFLWSGFHSQPAQGGDCREVQGSTVRWHKVETVEKALSTELKTELVSRNHLSQTAYGGEIQILRGLLQDVLTLQCQTVQQVLLQIEASDLLSMTVLSLPHCICRGLKRTGKVSHHWPSASGDRLVAHMPKEQHSIL